MVSNETLSCTSLGDWQEQTPVNLERALKVGDELGGHIVSGHVDGVGEIISIEPDADSHRFRFRAPTGIANLIAAKGSITIDGVSLTVNDVVGDAFGVNIIPHTMVVTAIGGKQVGDPVNMEVDMLARYVARLLVKE
jgi:riboflavin synthase